MAKDNGGASVGARDWSETLFLPKTGFPMKAGLPELEPRLLKRWDEMGLYQRLREAAARRPRFVLHDGPPYANGNIHIGHALNKILKDLVVRSQQMLGNDAPYVPGWDCHGLPIEWKIEEAYRAKGVNTRKEDIPINEFRAECREFAAKWIDVQREEFRRLGVVGDWANLYATMSFDAEAVIAAEIMKFAMNGLLYRGSKPVMWSVVEKTALAEAEVEYQDYQSDQVWVKFPVTAAEASGTNRLDALLKSSVVIWTTTPWTIPGNRAISYSPQIKYGLYRVDAVPADKWVKPGEFLILSTTLAEAVFREAKVTQFTLVQQVPAEGLSRGFKCAHPLRESGYDFTVPLLSGNHVTDDAGTGFVHTAPGHGADDYNVWIAATKWLSSSPWKIDTTIPFTVDADGVLTEQAPGFTGRRVLNEDGSKGDANEAVIKALVEAGNIIARGRLKHQYPHSWRSKKPVIFRNTPQWFIAMDKAMGGASSNPSWPGLTRPSSVGGSKRKQDWMAGSEAGHDEENGLAAPATGSLPLVGRDRVGGSPTAGGLDSPPPKLPHEGGGTVVGVSAEASGKALGDTLRARALRAIAETDWVPETGRNRITGMIVNRPDWVVSRQRAWGVPICVFRNVKTEQLAPSRQFAKSGELQKRVIAAFEAEGADAWFADGAKERFLDGLVPDDEMADWEQVRDILDVWFDSGSTHAFTLEKRPDLATLRADEGGQDRVMYLEGSDQHRGWFHSSLLEACGTRGRAPYDVVLTHGFILDEKGEDKMSKSKGNVLSPQDVMKTSGADILRLWVASSDTTGDIRFGEGIVKSASEAYRKVRNTLRWMLGALNHYEVNDQVPFAELPELERLMLHRLAELNGEIRAAYAAYDYRRVVSLLSQFLNADLSAFYFDIRKDTLYCEAYSSLKRHAALTVIDQIFGCVTVWLAPILPFTAEEAWLERYPESTSVHLATFPNVPDVWMNDALVLRWETIRRARGVVTGALELERAGKRIGSSLEAAPEVYVADDAVRSALHGIDFAEVCITSGIDVREGDPPSDAFRLPDVAGVAVVPARAVGVRCARSWRITTDVGSDPEFPDLSARDAAAVREFDARREAA